MDRYDDDDDDDDDNSDYDDDDDDSNSDDDALPLADVILIIESLPSTVMMD